MNAPLHPPPIVDAGRRAQALARHLNGIAHIEAEPDGRTLRVYFDLGVPDALAPGHVRIEGGVRVTGLQVVDVRPADAPPRDDDPPRAHPHDRPAIVQVDRRGDFSTYELALQGLAGFDPSALRRRFRLREAPGSLAAPPARRPPGPPPAPPQIDYLAKDYASFRQLLLDRLALTLPDWKETHVPDTGLVLVELLAYAADQLSYYQDAVATEAYLGTARQRVSIKRHARLVDYRMHEGCNARAWVCIETSADLPDLAADDCLFVTAGELGPGAGALLDLAALDAAPAVGVECYAPLLDEPITLRAAHSGIGVHAWGASHFVLPAGATRATLRDAFVDCPKDTAAPATRALAEVHAGQFVCFEEVRSPLDGSTAGAAVANRHVVRLTQVERATDPVCEQPIVEVEWAAEDALPFALTIATIASGAGCRYLGPARSGDTQGEDLVLARANVVLVDHGRWVGDEWLEPAVPPEATAPRCEGEGRREPTQVRPGVYGPQLGRAGLCHRERPRHHGPAAHRLAQDPRRALPQLRLDSIPGDAASGVALFDARDLDVPDTLPARLKSGHDAASTELRVRLSTASRRLLRAWDGRAAVPPGLHEALRIDLQQQLQAWSVRPDLLGSAPDERAVVVDIDNGRRARLRFGDGQAGAMPSAGSLFRAGYRVGGGPAGNVGAHGIAHLALRGRVSGAAVTRVWNPMPATGGTAPESIDDVRAYAPTAFRRHLARAITADDYRQLAARHAGVQQAAATLRWSGSRQLVRVAIDPLGSERADPALLAAIAADLRRVRRVGHEVELVAASYVPIDLRLTVEILPGHDADDVRRALTVALGHGRDAEGVPGFFHPDLQTFGTPLYLSRIIARAQQVNGVAAVVVTRLQRLHRGPNRELQDGVLKIAPDEIARLDNDPNFPENGLLRVHVHLHPHPRGHL